MHYYNHALFNRVRRISYTTYQSVLKKRKDRFCCKGYYGNPNYCKGTVILDKATSYCM